MTLPQQAALLFVWMSAGTVLFHLAMIAGAPWGHLTMGGRWPGRLPPAGRAAAAASALLTGGMATVVAGTAGLWDWTPPPGLIWGIVALIALSVIMHIFTPSRAERRLWLPVVALLFLSALIVAMN